MSRSSARALPIVDAHSDHSFFESYKLLSHDPANLAGAFADHLTSRSVVIPLEIAHKGAHAYLDPHGQTFDLFYFIFLKKTQVSQFDHLFHEHY
jgi:hypothetical protein